jgi:hypothetical protein
LRCTTNSPSAPFDLGDVVRHVIHQLHPECFGGLTEDRREGFANLMRDDLTIGKGRVRRTVHGGKIVLPLG